SWTTAGVKAILCGRRCLICGRGAHVRPDDARLLRRRDFVQPAAGLAHVLVQMLVNQRERDGVAERRRAPQQRLTEQRQREPRALGRGADDAGPEHPRENPKILLARDELALELHTLVE